MKEKVFIIGASGMIGEALHKIYSRKEYDIIGGDKEVLGNDCIFVDITEKDGVRRVISQVKPDIVIVTAALSRVDYCEEFPQESEKVNVDGVQNVLDAVDKEKTRMVYFSSDYIFDGLNGPYAEVDEPNPLCLYGRHKLIAEKLVQDALKNYLIVRTTWVYGPEARGKNFVLSLVRRLKNKERMKVPFDQIGSPTYSENLAEVVEELVQKEKTGIYNVAGPGLVDRYSFAREICRVFGLPENMLLPVTTQQLRQKAKRPLKAGLKVHKVMKEMETPLIGYEAGLRFMRKSYV